MKKIYTYFLAAVILTLPVNVMAAEDTTFNTSLYGNVFGIPVQINTDKTIDEESVLIENVSFFKDKEYLGIDVPKEKETKDISDYNGTWTLKRTEDENVTQNPDIKNIDKAIINKVLDGLKVVVDDGNISFKILWHEFASVSGEYIDGIMTVNTSEYNDIIKNCNVKLLDDNMAQLTFFPQNTDGEYPASEAILYLEKDA